MGKSSGNPEVDIAVVSAMYRLTMEGPYMVPAGQETFDITAPFVLSPSAKRG
ncbi:hypothetical protein PflQ2_0679 [Pseudomonas fluorescens Q2-87]|uniref:Uncharacterized protein n=1 Tax=Pseudomonas fluorescens (strain Q2-87) TaxID=1038922 RepID=J2F6V4_PSEFQ|nr:hypothetical protein PflQ2_0679 [Pseudomonas fluorescens Q2-87]